jgi:hypothetical protein
VIKQILVITVVLLYSIKICGRVNWLLHPLLTSV